MQSIAPPIVPSHVFLGEIEESEVLPIKEPTIYAMVSFIQIEATSIKGITQPKSAKRSSSLKNMLCPLRSIINAHDSEMYSNPKKECATSFRFSVFVNSTSATGNIIAN